MGSFGDFFVFPGSIPYFGDQTDFSASHCKRRANAKPTDRKTEATGRRIASSADDLGKLRAWRNKHLGAFWSGRWGLHTKTETVEECLRVFD
jgi:hypothetical protein